MLIFRASEFNTTNNFRKVLNFNYSFIVVNVDVSYYNSRKFMEVPIISKPEINGSNENIILIVLHFASSLFHLPIKQKPDVRIKIIPLVIYFLTGYSMPYQDFNVCSRSQFFTVELMNKFESLYTSKMHLQTVFLSISKIEYRNSNSYN